MDGPSPAPRRSGFHRFNDDVPPDLKLEVKDHSGFRVHDLDSRKVGVGRGTADDESIMSSIRHT